MAQKLTAGFTSNEIIGDSWQVVWDAVDPSTGASVSGVTISEANVTGDEAGDGGADVGNPILIGISA